jgi:hypothetical protein
MSPGAEYVDGGLDDLPEGAVGAVVVDVEECAAGRTVEVWPGSGTVR